MSFRRFYLVAGLLGLGLVRPAFAQDGVVVQLPTFSFFTVSTTVSVPDSGGAFAGGERRASSGYTAFGSSLGPRQRARGSDRTASGAHVTATVHDFEAADRALSGGAATGEGAPFVAGTSGRSSAERAAVGSLAAARARRRAAQQPDDREALAYAERARQATADGKVGAARVFLQMAARRASNDLKAALLRELDELSAPEATP